MDRNSAYIASPRGAGELPGAGTKGVRTMSPQSNGCQREEERPASAIGALDIASGAAVLKVAMPLDLYKKLTDACGVRPRVRTDF